MYKELLEISMFITTMGVLFLLQDIYINRPKVTVDFTTICDSWRIVGWVLGDIVYSAHLDPSSYDSEDQLLTDIEYHKTHALDKAKESKVSIMRRRQEEKAFLKKIKKI